MKILKVTTIAIDALFTLMGPIMVVGAVTLMVMVSYIFIWNIFPLLVAQSPLYAAFHILMAIFLLPNIFFHYYMSVFTRPGDTPEADPELARTTGRYCQKCQRPKPPRAHHCQLCKRCVLRMDHHCPWIAGCVGYYNHRYFVLFMAYLWLGCGYVGWNTWEPAILKPLELQPGFFDGRGGIVLSFILSVSVFFSVMLMTLWHLFLISTNQTTIEFYMNRYYAREARKNDALFINQYDVGYRRNFEQVFGRKWWMLLLPIPATNDGDGTTFPSRLGPISDDSDDLVVVLGIDGEPLGKGRAIPDVKDSEIPVAAGAHLRSL